MVRGAEKRTAQSLPLRRRSRAGADRRGSAISQNHLFALLAGKYVDFGQTASTRKGFEEAELLPAERASEQSSIGHWTNSFFVKSAFAPLRQQSLLYHISIAATK